MQFATVINRFWVQSNVPIHKAREMQMNGEIDDFDLIEEQLEGVNVQAPKTSLRWAEKEIEVITGVTEQEPKKMGRPKKTI